MKIKELDKRFDHLDVATMCCAVGISLDEYADFAWQETRGRLSPIAAGNLMRIGALIGVMYAMQLTGGLDGKDEKKSNRPC
jgi:hypothetical protein